MKNEVKPKKGIILGVTLPLDAQQDERVQAQCRRYLKHLRRLTLLLLVAALPALACPFISVTTLLMTLWTLPAIGGYIAVYGVANRRLHTLKQANGWGVLAGEQRATADLQVALRPFKVKWVWFLLADAAALLLLALAVFCQPFDETDVLLAATFAAMVLLCGPGCAFLLRKKSDTAGDDLTLNRALTALRRENWRHMWLLLAWSTAALEALYLFSSGLWEMVAGIVIYTGVLLAGAMWFEMRTRARQQALTGESGLRVYADEDDLWLLGQFYCNPNDSHLLVNSRVGLNTTVNLARPAGKVLTLAVAALLLLLPLFGVWMMSEEFSPIAYSLQNETLEVRQGFSTYRVAADDVQQVRVLDELPALRKRNGTNLPTLYKGSFSGTEIGRCTVLLDPRDTLFLLVETNEKTYLFSLRDDEALRRAANALT